MREIGNYCDDETRVIRNGLSMLTPSEQREAAKYARERTDAFIAGRAMVPDYWQHALNSYDPTLRMRYDFDHGAFVVDRWIEENGYWHTILIWRDENNNPLYLSESLLPLLLRVLAANNLQARYQRPQDYLAEKHAKRGVRQQQMAAARTEAVLEAVDNLSSKQINNFIDVHRAIHTGETIVCHGDDEKSIERMAKASDTAPPPPMSRGMNPGMNPMTYKRVQPRDVDGSIIKD